MGWDNLTRRGAISDYSRDVHYCMKFVNTLQGSRSFYLPICQQRLPTVLENFLLSCPLTVRKFRMLGRLEVIAGGTRVIAHEPDRAGRREGGCIRKHCQREAEGLDHPDLFRLNPCGSPSCGSSSCLTTLFNIFFHHF